MTLSYLSQQELYKVNIPHSCFVIVVIELLCPTLGDSMDCSTPGSSVLHCLLKFAQIRAHSVSLFQFSSVQLLSRV